LKLGIIGLPGSGKTTVFKALTGGKDPGESKGHQGPGVGVVTVEDSRLDFLVERYKPKKVTPVHVEYLDIAGLTGAGQSAREVGDRVLAHIRPVDALIHCVRFFDSPSLGSAAPLKDFRSVQEEIILADLAVIEKRVERIGKDMKKGRKELAEELALLENARSVLESGKPLRFFGPAVDSETLRGFGFLSSKPELILLNAGDDRDADRMCSAVEEFNASLEGEPHVAVDWIYADTEAEIARLDADDAREFLAELGLQETSRNRIIQRSFSLLRLIAFFTVSDKEVRVWPLRKGENALSAAGTVHTDMQRGFIRAEVISSKDFREAGSMAQAQKKGQVHLEGKEYVVNDGDIIFFRFNV
jgi:GTP-binding protein YchF